MSMNEERSLDAMIRPQPIGIFSGVASSLLLPTISDLDNDVVLCELLSGNCERELPPRWKFFQEAVRNNIDPACLLLLQDLRSAQSNGQRDLCEYNLFVLNPTLGQLKRLRTKLTGSLSRMLEVAAFHAGLVAQLPATFNLDGELLAWALACSAAMEIEQENYPQARKKLEDAVDSARRASPLLAAILTAQSAQVAFYNLGLPISVIQREYESAIAIAREHHLPGFLTDLWAQLGMMLQQVAGENRECLLAAVRAYQSALQTGLKAAAAPQLFADLHNNLGLAYLAIPSTDSSNQLRTGIAIQSFRTALAGLDTETHGELWARISMNLANALQYAPTSHPESNLIQAVEIYDQVLTIRTRAREPVAYAIVLLNQANALAHLGIFKPALEKAAEAYKLFQWYEQAEQAITARELVERINDAIAASNPQGESKLSEVPMVEHPLTQDYLAKPATSNANG